VGPLVYMIECVYIRLFVSVFRKIRRDVVYRSYLTDTVGRMHSDAQFVGSSLVPAHVEMMGFFGMGNTQW